MEAYCCSFTIAEISICLKSMFSLEMSESFSKFEEMNQKDSDHRYLAEFREVTSLNVPAGKEVFRERSTSVCLATDGSFYRLFRKYSGEKDTYAVGYYDWNNRYIRIEYISIGRNQFESVQAAFGHIAWETLLMQENRIMLHASFMQTPYGDIAFSGPSGIGKSTQGELWLRYGHAKLLNGDKLVLHRKQGEWIGYGSPLPDHPVIF